jgi:hypothetical protein
MNKRSNNGVMLSGAKHLLFAAITADPSVAQQRRDLRMTH